MPELAHDLAAAERFLSEEIQAALTSAGLDDWRVEPEPYTGPGKVVTWVFVGGEDQDVADSGDILFSYPLYRILARDAGRTIDAVSTAAQAVHERLNRRQATNADGHVFWCRRERPHRLTVTKGQESETSLGGDYRLCVKGA